jgi:uncharacterized repeat protein (TIGR03803 family)
MGYRGAMKGHCGILSGYLTAPLIVALALAAAALGGSGALEAAPANALSLTVLHDLDGFPDGSFAQSGVIRDSHGNLFGTAPAGGSSTCNSDSGCGTVFEFSKSGKFSVIYTFQGGTDGNNPLGVTQGPDGNFYGTTEGVNGAAETLYRLTPKGQKAVLWNFTDDFASGASPNSAPVFDNAGNLYGAAQYGGDQDCGYDGNGCGVIYEVDSKGNFHTLHVFKELKDGIWPATGIVIDSKGELYGSTAWGGDLKCPKRDPGFCGTVYKLDSDGTYTVMHRFTDKSDGADPGAVTVDANGNVYGTTGTGGNTSCYPPLGCGTIFKIDASGKFSVLFTFTSQQICCGPGYSGLILDSAGNLYGTSAINGASNNGFLFELDKKGNFSDLFDFPPAGENGDGSGVSGVLRDNHGDFYATMQTGGTSQNCGSFGCGTIIELSP